MPAIICPSCAYRRDVPVEKISPIPLNVRCPRCQHGWTVDGAALRFGGEGQLELDWGGRQPPPAAATPPAPDGVEILPPIEVGAPVAAGAPVEPELALPAQRVYEPVFKPEVAPGPPPPVTFLEHVVHFLRRPEPVAVADTSKSDRFAFDDFGINAWALPVAFGIAVAAKVLWLPGLLLDYFRVWLHEFGHALAAWLGSRAATPLALLPGLGWASVNPEKSATVYLCFLFLIGVTAYRAWRARSIYLLALALSLFLLQVWFTFLVSAERWELDSIWAGAGGELLLSTWLVVGFYYRLPDRLRWDFVRFIALVVAMYAFVSAFWLWARAVRNHELIPWGTGMWGRDDENGDMNRLREAGWSADKIARTYLTTALLCTGAILGHYFFHLRQGLMRRRRPAPAPTPDQAAPH